ncbi:MAG: S8 family serine peptidase [Bacteroidales bacterium]|nr:S8 family serine peptidase [Bacteroidales bacterium]
MKTNGHRNHSAAILMAILCMLSCSLKAPGQNQYRVYRGERPAIDVQGLSPDAYEQGVMKIKLKAVLVSENDQPAIKMQDGVVIFGIPSLDALNRRFGVRGFSRTFESKAFSAAFKERHRAWGFHQWFTLTVDQVTDIRAMVKAYAALEAVECAEPVYRKRLIANVNDAEPVKNMPKNNRGWTPNDPRFNEQWHYHNTGQGNGTPDADIDLPEAWDIEKGNSDLIVAVVDQGIQFNHPDIAANMWSGVGYNFVNDNSTIVPGDHGTHVAGTIAAVNNNGMGVAGIAGGSGTGNGVRLMSAQVFTASGSGGFDLAPVWAADEGASISQNSWGYTEVGVYEQSTLDAIDYFNANGGGDALLGGGITIYAAGNDGTEGQWYPGCYSGCFSVAATNNQDIKAWYSNFGSWVDISAPGGETNTVESYGVLSTLNGNTYGYYQGTSMACPHTSGVAALVVSLAYGELSPADLTAILQGSTDDIYPINPGFTGKLGSGRLNAFNALTEAQNYLNGVRNPTAFDAEAVDSQQISLSWVPNSDNNAVMLAWSPDGTFGNPVEGNSYNPGDQLPGGGTVLYKGNNTTYLHGALNPATTYYYRAWSYNAAYQYSTGKSADAATSCAPFSLPFSQSFEGSSLPQCWSQQAISGSLSWIPGAGNGGINPPNAHQGNTDIYVKTTETPLDGYTTRLISPQLLLAGEGNVQLKFWYANARRTYIIWTYQDVLSVYYKTAAGGSWNLLETFSANITDWTEATISLPNLTNDYYLAFESVAYGGHGVCLDQVSVSGSGGGNTYTIQASAGTNGTISPSGNVVVAEGASQAFQVDATGGYAIADLLVDNVTVGAAIGQASYTYTFQNVTQNHSIAASFSQGGYTVQLSVNPSGAGTVSGAGVYPAGSQVSAIATANSGYVFDRWTQNGSTISTDNPYVFTLTGNISLVAEFAEQQGGYLIAAAVEPANGGTVTGTGNYYFMQYATLTAIPAENFHFVAWKDNGLTITSANPFSFVVVQNRTVTAVFAPNSATPEHYRYQVRVFPNPAGSKVIMEFTTETMVRITAVDGRIMYAFIAGQGRTEQDVSGFAPGVYVVIARDKDKTAYGRFVKQ